MHAPFTGVGTKCNLAPDRAGQARGCSELQLSSSPVSPLSVVPDFVVGSVSAPVGEWSVLLDLFSHSDLLAIGFY